MSFKSYLTTALFENNISLQPEAIDKLVHYLDLLQKWNRVFNLTNVTEPKEAVYLHLIDSLLVSPYLQGTHQLDVGSGAGLPGLPLAILRPTDVWVLLDKNGKKTRFLTQAVAELGLTNIEVVQNRTLDFHPPLCFDSILSRAFGSLALFAEQTAHLLCPDGKLIAMKGKYPKDELSDVPASFVVDQIARLSMKGMSVERHVICLRKKG